MPGDQIRIEYATLEQTANRFTTLAESETESLNRILYCLQLLQDGAWRGEAANAFFAEMDEVVVPALRRLIATLQQGNTLAQHLRQILREGEEEAAQLFRGQKEPGPTSNHGAVTEDNGRRVDSVKTETPTPSAKPVEEASAAKGQTSAGNATLTLSENGLNFIILREGFRDHPYNDSKGHATIGYGHLLHRGPVTAADRQQYSQPLSKAAAREILSQDIERFATVIRQEVRVPLNQHQFDALVSFTFNVGNSAFRNSTLLKELNNGHYEKIAYEMGRWTDHGNKGKITRREWEGKIFNNGEYP